jgi:hypothetical protein
MYLNYNVVLKVFPTNEWYALYLHVEPTSPPLECVNSIYGCCPGKTDASATGPNYEGCEVINRLNCSLSYFKCCPDGVKAALGPNLEGCDLPCEEEKFGCCQDKRTPAHGPNFEGCCLGSLYGCCPDNTMAAKGPHFEGKQLKNYW